MDAQVRSAAAGADERTIVTPRPPRRLAVARTASTELQRLVAGVNPLLGAANVLLALVAPLRTTTTHADPHELHRQLLARLDEFERDARAAGVSAPHVGAARYVLCSFLDEVVAATPWGASAGSLLEEFHDESDGGDKAFKLLERLGEDTAGNADLLELFYVCISLGFEGRYRGAAKARAQLDAIAERLYEVVRQAQGPSRSLSPHWQGIAPPHRRALSVLPLWAVVAVGAAAAIGALVWLNAQIDARSAPVFRHILGVPALFAQADRSAAAGPARLASRLQTDIRTSALSVRDEGLRSVVSVPADALFATGGARVEPARAALLGRVAKALAELPGQVIVSGHTDSEANPSVQFPTNWHLSRARALAVADALAANGVAAQRLRAEGRADAEPLAAETSPAGRSRNRRIEIELRLPRPDTP